MWTSVRSSTALICIRLCLQKRKKQTNMKRKLPSSGTPAASTTSKKELSTRRHRHDPNQVSPIVHCGSESSPEDESQEGKQEEAIPHFEFTKNVECQVVEFINKYRHTENLFARFKKLYSCVSIQPVEFYELVDQIDKYIYIFCVDKPSLHDVCIDWILIK